MSMALFVILARDRAPTADAWQKALHERNVPIELDTTGVDLRRHGAGLPHQFERLSAHSSHK